MALGPLKLLTEDSPDICDHWFTKQTFGNDCYISNSLMFQAPHLSKIYFYLCVCWKGACPWRQEGARSPGVKVTGGCGSPDTVLGIIQ